MYAGEVHNEAQARKNDMEYYVIDASGQKYGPANAQTLNQWAVEGRINAMTTVEAANGGMRMPVTSVPGFQLPAPSGPAAQQGYGPNFGVPTGQFASNPYGVVGQKVESNLVKAIFVTLCCCMPLGIVSIVFAAKVDGLARGGAYQEAQDAAAKANTFANWGIGLGLVWTIIYVLGMVMSGMHS